MTAVTRALWDLGDDLLIEDNASLLKPRVEAFSDKEATHFGGPMKV